MNQSPLISVILPVYNCEQYIKAAVQSILNQTYGKFELLIIDDASSDNTVARIEEFKDNRIKLTVKAQNTGYTNSLNYALKIVKGNYIARMDADDIAHPERFERQVKYMNDHPKTVACGTGYKILGKDQIILPPQDHESIKIQLLHKTCFGHPTVMLRKSVFVNNGLQYAVDKEPAEDYNLWVQLLAFGQLHNLQEVLLDYRMHDQQVSRLRRSIQLKSKLSTRIQILEYVYGKFSKDESSVMERALLGSKMSIDDIQEFLQIKHRLLHLNNVKVFFKKRAFKNYFYKIEHELIHNYFLRRRYFKPKVYKEYLMIKVALDYKLPLKSQYIIGLKSLIFFRISKFKSDQF